MKAPLSFSMSLLLVSLLVLPRHGTVLAWASSSSSSGKSDATPPRHLAPAVPSCSIVTGGNGYVGRAILHEILNQMRQEGGESGECTVLSLVRPSRVASETEYWAANHHHDADVSDATLSNQPSVQVLPYDMLDGGSSLRQALGQATVSHQQRQRGGGATTSSSSTCRVALYHTAAVFGPTENHRQTALDNVRGTEDLVRTLAVYCSDSDTASMQASLPTSARPAMEGHLILTSSMAAVRASGQVPSNGEYYTHNDWNSESKLGASWGESYQWSKAESERKAWQLSRSLHLPMTSMCPSFVFGPPISQHSTSTSSLPTPSGSYSLELVGEWVRGASPVQSRLFVDVRDVALAHVRAAHRPHVSAGQRYVVSTEARVPSQTIAEWLREACRNAGLGDPSLVHYDANFSGGSIRIGEREVEATDRLERDLGVTLRPVKDTMVDMANILLQQRQEGVDVASVRSN